MCVELPTQEGLRNKHPNFFIGKSILFVETYGDDIGMGDFKVKHWKKEDGKIILYDKDYNRYCPLEYAKCCMLANEIAEIKKKDKPITLPTGTKVLPLNAKY